MKTEDKAARGTGKIAVASSDSRPAKSEISAGDGKALDVTGKVLTVVSGLEELSYRAGTKVTLKGPAEFFVESGRSGDLFYGKSRVRVEKNCKFTLSTPTVVLTGADAEFGIEGDRVGDGWIQVFRGRAKLWMKAEGEEATREIVLDEHESAQLGQRGGTCIATIIHDADLAAALASRMPPREFRRDGKPLLAQAAAGVRDRNAGPFSGEEVASVAATWSDNVPAPTRTSAPIAPHGVTGPTTYILRTHFTPSNLVPGKAAAEAGGGRGLATSAVSCQHLYGPRHSPERQGYSDSRAKLRYAVRQVGLLSISEGIVEGINTLEFEVRSSDPRDVLPEGVLSGKDPPITVVGAVWTRPSSPAKMPPPNRPNVKEGRRETKRKIETGARDIQGLFPRSVSGVLGCLGDVRTQTFSKGAAK